MYIYLDVLGNIYRIMPKFRVFISNILRTFVRGGKGKGTLMEIYKARGVKCFYVVLKNYI